jgi:TolB-like protein/Tfp pilus assembly protein PilF/predicted Ser/Thr protein kinase
MINKTIAHYRITAKLGQGGMGEVYRATDTKLDRDVAIKVLPQEICDDPARRKRFLKEAKAASSLNHPNVCTIYEVGETEDGQPFLAMEFLPGQTLDLLAENKPLENEKVVDIGSQIADALDAAMQAGIIHRDIKPANIHRDAQGRVKVLDFGLAKRMDSAPTPDASTAEQTEAGKLMGTPSYMSPEQARGEDLDHRSDLFSAGIVLYQLTTGRLPFEGSTLAETVEKITHTQPEAIARFNYEISPELERIIRKCLEKKPEDRYQSARELLIDFRRLQRDSSTQEAALPEKQHSWKAFIALAGVAVVAMVLLGIWWSRRDAGLSDAFRFGKSVAVLPFRSDEEFRFVADGLGEELAGGLSRLDNIERVPPFSSSERLKGDALDLESIANQLRVSTLLQGSIRRAAQTLMISAELVEPYSDSLIWQETYEYDQVTEVPFRIYKEIAQSIAQALDIELSSEQEATLMTAHTTNPRAWQAYLEGRSFWARRGPDLWRARNLFNLALSCDSATGREESSEFALAWVGLSDTYMQMATYGLMRPAHAFPKAIEYANMALKINPTLGDAYATLGFCQLFYEADLVASDRSFQEALKLNPRDIEALHWYMYNLSVRGRHAQAIATCEKACEIDPQSDIALHHLSLALYVAEEIQRAEEEFGKLVARSPDVWLWHMGLGWVLLEGNDPQEAVRELELAVQLSGRLSWALSGLGRAYASAGHRDDALHILDELEARSQTEYVNALYFCELYIAIGEHGKAMEKLREAVDLREAVFTIHFWPLYRPLWKEPAFIELVNQIGVARYDSATGRFEAVEQAQDKLNGMEIP